MVINKIALLTDIYTDSSLLGKIFLGVNKTNSVTTLLPLPYSTGETRCIHSVGYVPEYLETVIGQPNKWTRKSYHSVTGYAVALDEFKNVKDYLLHQHSTKTRNKINRVKRRLEQCFNIRYTIYEGDITIDEYTFLMNTLKGMIISRFRQKQQRSDSLAVWDKVLNSSYELIKEGKASLYVIYDRDKPINISLNYHYNRILFGYISSYDIDYSKFRLGQIWLYKHLEWCFDKGFNHFELGWGDLEYKKQWCNYVYTFRHEIIYPKGSLSGFLYATYMGTKTSAIAYLISKGVNLYWQRIKRKLGKHRVPQSISIPYHLCDFSKNELLSVNPISWEDHKVPITRKIVNDFLFSTQEHLDNVRLFYVKEMELFVLKGKKQMKSVHFETPA